MKASTLFSKGLYQWTRNLHLYFGLFICPFILVYAVSTIFLNHSIRPSPSNSDQVSVPIQVSQDATGMELVNQVLEQLELSGEILGRGMVRNNQTTIRVARPGAVKIITVNLQEQQATIVERSTGLLGALTFLHFNPGLHKPANWAITKLWGWLADSVVYLSLFLTISGVYLWALIKTERRIGLIFLGAGFVSFVTIVGALVYF